MQMPALRQQAVPSVGIWMQLYHHLDQPLTRLDTLTELASWEDSPTTPSARKYQQSLEKEANRIMHTLERQVTTILAVLGK